MGCRGARSQIETYMDIYKSQKRSLLYVCNCEFHMAFAYNSAYPGISGNTSSAPVANRTFLPRHVTPFVSVAWKMSLRILSRFVTSQSTNVVKPVLWSSFRDASLISSGVLFSHVGVSLTRVG